MNRGPGSPTYAIAAVSKLTGISCHALRVWERRHGFPQPERTEHGHRRYSVDQVSALRWIAAGLKQGRDLPSLMDEARSPSRDAPAPSIVARDVASSPARSLVDALLAGDVETAETRFESESQGLDFVEIVERMLEPAWIDSGDRLFRGLCGLDQERIAGEFVRRKLIGILDFVKRRNPQARGRVLLSTMVGDRHEGGVLILAIHLELAGWRALVLGTELPIETLLQSVERFSPEALGVSFILSRNIRKRFAELALVKRVPVFVGGRSLLNYQSLARRHGLIPLPGPARLAIRPMIARIESSLSAESLARWRESQKKPR